ncbi:nucleotidyltransferase domain-containing protein [Clostridium tagluense]|uniref:nucleotidyltransferase domain-containing protein n=1 Tax=Clostridium tagluense TaxID=360422 RepID=UPI001C0CF69F|nr:nucleotidyltransferase domain-containing protein [Clostridium tagluense]MBU3129944.1 nucleotidyltransferase domain-containing protein [Clostridium tagluense]MCB2311961.1 nucleotidyltransferase domain-containing protein [Clostridium tagluense]MCB2318128.1 nucleotidyltransferase domain-containing protein [Clostridium tagluense]MCB2323335.1 nucleotidyltransferase domain-containing protein [Clostridium tagluense]MCB2327912.1 nucleotidyltransferase domain-containing protein [Clostridium tagluens
MKKSILENIKNYFKEQYNCHSIILYGSFANDTYTDESDIDIICFCDNVLKKNDTTIINGRQLDAWMYNTNMMTKEEELLHIKGGKILLDEKDLCAKLLANIDKLFNEGAKKLTLEDINFHKSWLMKMLNRAKKGDVEGDFRYHWMLVDSLTIYFGIKGLWYLGPKKSLHWLKENDGHAYKLFNDALNINSSFEKTENLISFIVKS